MDRRRLAQVVRKALGVVTRRRDGRIDRPRETRRRLDVHLNPWRAVVVHFLHGRALAHAGGQETATCRRLRRTVHGVEQRGRDLQVHPVPAGLFLRPYGEPVLALGAVRRRLHEDEQQREFQDRRRALQPPVRVVNVDDRAVIDRLALVGRAEHLTVDRAAQHDRSALGADLLGHHRPQRPDELPRPADGRDGIVAGRHRLTPSGLFGLRLRLDGRAVDPGVPAAIGRIAVGVAGRGSVRAIYSETFAGTTESGRLRQANRLATRNRVPLRRRPLQGPDRRPLRRVAEVDVGAGDQVPRVIDVVPVRQVQNAAHALNTSSYQPSEARPSTPLEAPPNIGLSRRCASTPSSKFRLSRSSTPRP